MTESPIKLRQIVEAMESQSDEVTGYLDRKARKVIHIMDDEMRGAEEDEPLESFPECEREDVLVARAIAREDPNYVPLPDRFDIDDYRIMERFCLSIKDEDVSDTLYRAIKGTGAFRRFRDAIHEHGIADDWHECRRQAYRKIAARWCEANDIQYAED